MEPNTAKLSNSDLSFFDEGKGSPLLLLHGFCGSKRYWEKIIPELSKNHRVIAPDLPGHGESSMRNKRYSIEEIAGEVKELLAYLEIEKITLFGHSLGGYITLAFAEKYADQLNAFSLIHSTAFPDSEEAKEGRVANVEKVRENGIKELIDGLVPKLFSPLNAEKNIKDIETTKEIGYGTSAKGVINALLAMKERPDRNSVLENTSLPVLLIAGEKDQIIPAEKTFSVSKDNIKEVTIKDSGHMSMYENPDELLKAMKILL